MDTLHAGTKAQNTEFITAKHSTDHILNICDSLWFHTSISCSTPNHPPKIVCDVETCFGLNLKDRFDD